MFRALFYFIFTLCMKTISLALSSDTWQDCELPHVKTIPCLSLNITHFLPLHYQWPHWPPGLHLTLGEAGNVVGQCWTFWQWICLCHVISIHHSIIWLCRILGNSLLLDTMAIFHFYILKVTLWFKGEEEPQQFMHISGYFRKIS